MAVNVPIMQGQTVADIAVQELGSAEALFALAFLNNMSVSDDLVTGQLLNCNMKPYSSQVVKEYKDNGYKPACGTNGPGQEQPVQLAGISYWAIIKDFIVS